MSTSLIVKRKQQIIDAALLVFGEKGFHRGTVNDVALAANIGKGTIYEYFDSKQQIFEEMILSIIEDYLKKSMSLTDSEIPVKSKLIMLIDFNKEFFLKKFPIIKQALYGLQKSSQEFNNSLYQLHQEIYQFILVLIDEAKKNGEINQDFDDNLLALLWINMITGINSSADLFNITESIEPSKLVDIMFKGIENK